LAKKRPPGDAANDSDQAVKELLEQMIEELRICVFCIGAQGTRDLKGSPSLLRRKD
jgi:isopentenyl diphosphate isomerase/L-lactate dehydrogenase-like FMN-dependent dehydrogenase